MRENWSYQLAWPPRKTSAGERESLGGLPLNPCAAIGYGENLMEMRGKRVLVCNCDSTMPLEESALTRACQAVGAEGRSEEHTSELQSLMRTSYAVFCLKKK